MNEMIFKCTNNKTRFVSLNKVCFVFGVLSSKWYGTSNVSVFSFRQLLFRFFSSSTVANFYSFDRHHPHRYFPLEVLSSGGGDAKVKVEG